MRDRVRSLADEPLDEAVEKARANGSIDFLDFACQFPLAVICELLGLPGEDRLKFTRWASRFSSVNSLMGLLTRLLNLFKINGYFHQQIRSWHERPRQGLMSLLVEVQNSGDTLSDDELSSMAFLLLFAGHETTTHLISGGLLTLLDHSQQKLELMSDWEKGETEVDELLRFNTPVRFTKKRIASRDMKFYGQDIKRGDYLIAMLAVANSDLNRFGDLELLDI